MKVKFNKILGGLITLSAILFSCNDKKDIIPLGKNIPIEYSDTYTWTDASLFFGDYEVIPLSNQDDDALIIGIDRLLFDDDKVFVVDRMAKKVMAFDKTGCFLASTVNSIGQGPNQYVSLLDAAIDVKDKKILIACDAPYCIMVFDYDLQFEKMIKLDYYLKEIAVDDKFIYGLRWNTEGPSDELLVLDKKDPSQSPRVLLSNSNLVVGLGVLGKSLISYREKGLFASLPFDNNIFQIQDGEIISQYSMDFGKKGIKSLSLKDVSADLFMREHWDKEWAIKNVSCSDSLIIFNTNGPLFYAMDVKNQKCQAYNGLTNDILPFTNSLIIPSHGLSDAMVYETEPSLFRNYLEWTAKDSSKLKPERLRIAQLYNDEANPIVIVWKFKK